LKGTAMPIHINSRAEDREYAQWVCLVKQ